MTEAASTPVLAVAGVTKRFGVVTALHGVSLSVSSGEIMALVGENGAGKSTLMRLVEGVFPPDEGEIRVEGRAVAFAEPADAHRLGIRVIHQEPEIVPGVTVAENLFLGALPRSARIFVDWRELDRRTRELLAGFRMADLDPRRLCETLGPAQRQIIEIARAVRAGGRVIAFDEPTSSLTDEEARRLFELIQGLKASGVAVIYISHRLNEIVAIADRVAVLRDGSLVADRPLAGLTEPEIATLMVGRDLSGLYRRSSRVPGDVLLEVDSLSTEKVHGVSLSVRRGEVLGIGGLMGAGRSELARGIVGFDQRLGGSVRVAGQPVRPGSPADSIAAGIGLAPEDRKHEALLLLRDIVDNIVLVVPGRVSTGGFFRARAARDLAADMARRLDVRAAGLQTLVSRLSGGNQQKVVLARWLARRPAVLILDEPTRGIDVGAKAEIYRLIDEIASAGMGIILISSEMPELLGLADRILVMAGGRVTGELTHPEASEQRILELAMEPERERAA